VSDSTIYDIAKACGVSIATVSRVLNKNARVHTATRQKVLSTAEQMGYSPKVWARNMAHGRSNMFTVIVPVISNYFFMEILAGMQDRIENTGFDLNIYNVRNGAHFGDAVEARIRRGLADGFVLISAHLGQEDLNGLKKLGFPVVLVDDYNPLFDSVSCDNAEGAFSATKYLIEKGGKSVGIISAHQLSVPARERINGYKAAIQSAGRLINPGLVYVTDSREKDGFTEKTGFEGAMHLLKNNPDLDGLFVTSDVQGIGALKAMREFGRTVPMVCFDDIEMARYFGLTTMHQPLYEMGAMAIDLLIRKSEEASDEKKHTVFSPRLVVRDPIF
jgi:LacI family transcriptional regulator